LTEGLLFDVEDGIPGRRESGGGNGEAADERDEGERMGMVLPSPGL
jgi:hypothetical protein